MNLNLQLLGKKTIRLHLKDGRTFEGLLLSRFGRHITLAQAKTFDEAANITELDGLTIIPRENVAFWQEVTIIGV